MNRGSLEPNLKLTVPSSNQASFAKFLTQSGTFKEGNLLVNKDGVRIVSQSEDEAQPPIKPVNNQISLAELDTIKVVGKGNGGIVQLVQHKWTNQFFALKQIQMTLEESTCRRIAQELKINQSSQCPHVVVCYQAIYYNGTISIILEYMDGGSLEDLLNKVKTIPEPFLAAICKQPATTWQTSSAGNRRIIRRYLRIVRYSTRDICCLQTSENCFLSGSQLKANYFHVLNNFTIQGTRQNMLGFRGTVSLLVQLLKSKVGIIS
ncbi:mitogen-activated protein kinase kinase [Trifolium repens]|nr:mitogen-activated protein kinase kinase [Trifolium repens]